MPDKLIFIQKNVDFFNLKRISSRYFLLKIRYFGLNKIDSKVIENKKKKDILASLELNQTMLTLKARKNLIQIKSLKRKIEITTSTDEIEKINTKIETLKEENKIIKQKLDKLKKK